jgi:hypothetical protein
MTVCLGCGKDVHSFRLTRFGCRCFPCLDKEPGLT